MLVFVRVRCQQHALVLVYIVFRVEEIVGNCWKLTCKDQMTRRIVRYASIIMLSASSTSKRLTFVKHQSILVQINVIHIFYTILLFISRSPQDSLEVLLTQQAQAGNSSRRSDICNRFRKLPPTFLSSVRSSYAEWRLSVVHDRVIDHRIYAESLEAPRLLSLPPLPSPHLIFLSRLETDAASSSRLSLYRAHRAVNNLPQKFDNRLKMSVQCHVLLDSTDLQSVMYLADWLAFNPPRNFFTLAYISHVHLWRSIYNN